jgi:glutathione synthase/RimK-type ligase-like ATP-grasp enzyme
LTPPLLFERTGLPIPQTIYAASADRTMLRRGVDWLGGFPVIVKWLGRSRGIGVLRVDSFPALFSLMDYAAAGSVPPLLCQYIADAIHFRLVVIGRQVVVGYRNAQEPDDFRSYGSEDVADYIIPIDPGMADLAVRATDALQIEMAGVDILRSPDGKLYLLEANFPCYFAQAQYAIGVDVAGMMINYLLTKAGAQAVPPTDAY